MTTTDVMILLVSMKDTLLGAVGGTMAYLVDYMKAKKEGDYEFNFVFGSMLVLATLGAFASYVIGTAVTAGTQYRDVIIALSGFTAYPILLVAGSKFVATIVDVADRLTGNGSAKDNNKKGK